MPRCTRNTFKSLLDGTLLTPRGQPAPREQNDENKYFSCKQQSKNKCL